MAIEEDPSPGVPEWIITFGDMMSLLLTFFIMLASMSEIKQDSKYQGVADSLYQQFGYDKATVSLVPGWARPRNTEFATATSAGHAKRKDAAGGASKERAAKGDFPSVRIIRPGTQTAVGTVIFFDENSADLSPQSQEEIKSIGPHIGGKPQKIEVRGHTSQRPVPAGGAVADNWDLAYRRARNTMKFLVEQMDIDPRRLRMSVAGPNEPLTLDANATPSRQNPRVEVFLLDETISESQPSLDKSSPTEAQTGSP